jgi:regulator of sigma E protease
MSEIFGILPGWVQTLLAAAVVLGVLIFVHELGHFITAKLVDIEVPRFSIGFGPRILGFKRGETEYVISALPLGGYVKMAGMEEMENIEGPDPNRPADATAVRKPGPRDFESKPLWARMLVISAGVIMNILFAFVAFAAIGVIWGVPKVPDPVIGNIIEEYLPEGATALTAVPRLARVNAVGRDTIENFEELRLTLTTARSGQTEIRFADAPPVTIDVPANDSARLSLIASFDPVQDAPPVLGRVTEGEPADRAGLRAGDRIVGARGEPVDSWQEFAAAIESSVDGPLQLQVNRGGSTLDVSVDPEVRELPNGVRVARIGVSSPAGPLIEPRVKLGVGPAVAWGVTETWRWVGLTFDFLGGMLSGRISPRQMGGPVMITQISGEAARLGMERFLNFMALLSVNLAVLNLLPIPVLDGGHLVFLLIEAVRRKPVSIEARIRWTKVGFVLIIMLMVFALGNDLVRWIGL